MGRPLKTRVMDYACNDLKNTNTGRKITVARLSKPRRRTYALASPLPECTIILESKAWLCLARRSLSVQPSPFPAHNLMGISGQNFGLDISSCTSGERLHIKAIIEAHTEPSFQKATTSIALLDQVSSATQCLLTCIMASNLGYLGHLNGSP